MRKNKFLISLIAFILFSQSAAIAIIPLEDFSSISIETKNDAFTNYIPSPNDGSVSGYIPSPVKFYGSSSNQISLLEEDPLPASFDLRNVNNVNYVTPIKDQGSEGVCWSFASSASLESNMLKKYNSLLDYSEAHMAYSLSKFTDISDVYNDWGFERSVNGGGNFSMAMAYYARGSGPVLESNDPYTNLASGRNYAITKSKPVDRYVSDMYVLPDDEDISTHYDKIKRMVMEYGAVNTAFYSSDTYYNSNKTAYYYPGTSKTPNHAVAIIGWNDNYSNTNFNSNYIPSGNGAFLIKNSWGNYNANGGYFWLSYYDYWVGTEASCIAKSKDVRYDNIHQYDPFGYTNAFTTGASSVIANQYDCIPGEILKAIGFFTVTENMYYEVYINKDEGNDTADFDTMNDPITTGILPYSGYHTIPLDNPLTLTGIDFSVLIVFVSNNGNGGSTAYIPYEKNCNDSLGNPYLTQASQNEGEGYIYCKLTDNVEEEPAWHDAATILGGSLCIKALTDNPPVIDNLDYTISYTKSDNTLLETIQSGTVKTKFEVTNNTNTAVNLNGIAALYKDNKLYDIKIADLSNLSNNKISDVSFNVPADGGYYIKGMIFDKDNMPMPVLKTFSVLESGNSILKPYYSKNTVTLKAGGYSSLNLLGTAGGFNCDLTHRYTWTSGDSNIATVSLSGRITGVSVGETYIKSDIDSIPKLKVIVTN